MLHEYKDFIGDNLAATLTCELQSTLTPTVATAYLQIYNRDTTTWENVDSNDTADADTDFVLTGIIANTTDYVDVQQIISCRVYQEAM